MLDKNGREIRTGDVVQITGAFFKRDNAIYFVDRSPNDEGWNGNYHSLHRISKKGKISITKYNLCSWPISIFTNDHFKKIEGNAWNKEHAQIEILNNVPKDEIIQHFEEECKEEKNLAEHYLAYYGKDNHLTRQYTARSKHFENVLAYIKGGTHNEAV